MNASLLLSSVALALALYSQAYANENRMMPEDEADRDLSLVEFREQMRQAVDQKNVDAFLRMVAEDVSVSAKKSGGLNSFKKSWQIESLDSELWPTMKAILSMGGGFLRSERGVKFCAPYTFVNFPSNLDIYAHGIVIKDNVAVKASPSQNSANLLNLSYHVVKVADWRSIEDNNNPNFRWLKIKTLEGREGYVEKTAIRSPADYSACFLNSDDEGWKLISLIAGD